MKCLHDRLSLRGLLPHGDNGARTKYLQRWGSAGAQHVQTTLTTWWQSCMRHLGLQHEATAGKPAPSAKKKHTSCIECIGHFGSHLQPLLLLLLAATMHLLSC